ncbi:SAM-dependent methyltransferase [Cohnella pontilimi]|uniref:SAM-dependent methyltransferase n=1 Tax=Cohnella pontilimi TaxID=2564100 RepID=A0A4U0FGV7_9BACL|nr:class I SAM-dependent methyltransferase [Cohnella pontilimi]TJY44243.1 SAM-dependent methyltransferase [Cohnella pontilimi]
MIVTTAERPAAELVDKAVQLAGELGVRFVPRRQNTLRGLERKYGPGEGVLVVSAAGLRYVSEDGSPLFFHPSMALVRLKRLVKGGSDNMLSVSGAAKGDMILDCTAGLGSDAIVFSYAVGSEGQVTALEASPLLYTVVREGLREADTGLAEADAACRRIELKLADHYETLCAMPDRSMDIIYFDPMFERAVSASSSLRPLRSHARHESLTEEAVCEAVRVARKAVVLKNSSGSGEFERLGFSPARLSSSTVAYGVIRIEPHP